MATRHGSKRKGQTLYVKNPVAHRLAAQISKHTGMTLTEAVVSALEEKIQRASRPLDRAKLDSLCSKISALPIIDSREPDEILGYDELGIPR